MIKCKNRVNNSKNSTYRYIKEPKLFGTSVATTLTFSYIKLFMHILTTTICKTTIYSFCFMNLIIAMVHAILMAYKF